MTGAGYGPKKQIMPPVKIKAKPKPEKGTRDYGYTSVPKGSEFDRKQQAFFKQMQKMNQAPIDALRKRTEAGEINARKKAADKAKVLAKDRATRVPTAPTSPTH